MDTLPQIIKYLRDSGLSERQIADLVDTTQATINRIYTGVSKRPSYKIGKALEDLYRERSGQNQAA